MGERAGNGRADAAAAVDADRLWADIEENGRIGATGEGEAEGRGRTVLCGSDANREARDRLVARMEAAGLEVRVDAVGNVAGRWAPPGAEGEPVAAGSHLDSVPAGGIFDGPLGVYAALEAVRAMQAAGTDPARPVEVVSFTEEEGTRFGPGLLGSSVAAGVRSPGAALARTDGDGTTLEAALERIGYRGEGRLDAAGWEAWLELHVEQHTRLEERGLAAGVVTAITGITHCDVRIEGVADHAGATPMADRTDALAAAADVIRAVEDAARERARSDPSAVGTVGRCEPAPNATNVVPGEVDLGVDLRSTERASVDAELEALEKALTDAERDRGVDTACERVLDLDPTPMAERPRAALSAAAERAGVGATELHSGAAHDSMHVAGVTDAGMLFVPSRDGVSHSPREWTDPADCADATRVLAGALADLAGAGRG